MGRPTATVRCWSGVDLQAATVIDFLRCNPQSGQSMRQQCQAMAERTERASHARMEVVPTGFWGLRE